jgi:hypothetical protein
MFPPFSALPKESRRIDFRTLSLTALFNARAFKFSTRAKSKIHLSIYFYYFFLISAGNCAEITLSYLRKNASKKKILTANENERHKYGGGIAASPDATLREDPP